MKESTNHPLFFSVLWVLMLFILVYSSIYALLHPIDGWILPKTEIKYGVIPQKVAYQGQDDEYK